MAFMRRESLPRQPGWARTRQFSNIDKSVYKGKKMRNATTLTIAPTGTISRIAAVPPPSSPSSPSSSPQIIDGEIKDCIHLRGMEKAHPQGSPPDYFRTAHEIRPNGNVSDPGRLPEIRGQFGLQDNQLSQQSGRQGRREAYLLAYELDTRDHHLRDGSRAEQVLYKPSRRPSSTPRTGRLHFPR